MKTQHHFHPTILREYDIRGRFGDTLTTKDAYAVGWRFAARFPINSTICVGRDGRISSPALSQALIQGLTDQGCAVMDVGCGPTPLLYFAVQHLNAAAGIMVTGSHNPPDENGLKLTLKDRPFYGEDIRALAHPVAPRTPLPQKGLVVCQSLHAIYCQRLLDGFPSSSRPLTVVWDPGHGATAEFVTELVMRLPCTSHVLNGTIDPTFPAHHPDPTEPKNLKQLIETVSEKQADLGIAFDGDGDRIGVVDGMGRILWGDQLMILFARDVLNHHPGATIIGDVKASQTLFDFVSQQGGRPLMGKTGHSLIKALMKETGALLAGEMSGHIFFADRYYGFDDALYAALRLLTILLTQNQSLAEFYDTLPLTYNTPEIRIPCEEEKKFKVVAALKEKVTEGTINTVDGLRVSTADGWWLVRASNTQAVLVARCEGTSEAGLARLKETLVDVLRRVDPTLQARFS